MLTALAILGETNGFNLFRKKGQLVSFSGYDVKTKQSGTSVNERARISKQENSFTRAALFFPAITAVKYCPHLQKAYERIYQKTGIKMKGYTATQRKLLVLIYSVYNSKEVYQADYKSPKRPVKSQG